MGNHPASYPPGTIGGDSRTRVLLAVQARQFPTITTVAIDTGLNRATVYAHLIELWCDELVSWEGRKAGTLRALVRPVLVP